jgi:hypothetical protein
MQRRRNVAAAEKRPASLSARLGAVPMDYRLTSLRVCPIWLLPLVGFGARDGVHKSRDFVDIQLAIVIPVCMSELHFEKSEYLSL